MLQMSILIPARWNSSMSNGTSKWFELYPAQSQFSNIVAKYAAFSTKRGQSATSASKILLTFDACGSIGIVGLKRNVSCVFFPSGKIFR